MKQIADLQFVVNLGDFSSASGLKPRVSEILAEIANLQIPPNLGDFSNIADDAGAGRKGGLLEYARQVGRAQQTIMEWVNAARVAKNLMHMHKVFDKPRHLSEIHAAPQELWPVFAEALLAQDWTVADTKAAKSDRRNLSDADILRWIAEVDKRKTKSEAGKAGGRGNEKLTQDCVSFKVKGDHHARASSAATAAVVGTSARKVERAGGMGALFARLDFFDWHVRK